MLREPGATAIATISASAGRTLWCTSRTTKMLTPERWLADFEKIEIREEVRSLILKENAIRLLGLDG